jgi:hypothetical protein
MTIASTTNLSSSQTVPAASPTAKPTPPKPESTPAARPTDTVQLSHVAQAALASLKEAIETPAQTAKEAVGGDLQAKRLLAKETAAKLNK